MTDFSNHPGSTPHQAGPACPAWIRMLLVVGLGLLSGAGCTEDPGAGSDGGRTLLAVGIDRSGSIRLRDEAVQRVSELIESLQSGRVTVRWISAASYRAEETILDVELSTPTACTNPYAPRCRGERAQRLRIDRARRDSALAVLRNATAGTAHATDIVGFLAAASDWLEAAGPEARHVVALATDLEDTAGRRVDGLDLRNVQTILVWQQADDDPSRAYRRRSWFDEIVRAAGANAPRYLPLTMRMTP